MSLTTAAYRAALYVAKRDVAEPNNTGSTVERAIMRAQALRPCNPDAESRLAAAARKCAAGEITEDAFWSGDYDRPTVETSGMSVAVSADGRTVVRVEKQAVRGTGAVGIKLG